MNSYVYTLNYKLTRDDIRTLKFSKYIVKKSFCIQKQMFILLIFFYFYGLFSYIEFHYLMVNILLNDHFLKKGKQI